METGKKICTGVLLITAATAFDMRLKTVSYKVKTRKLSEGNGIRLALLTDLHSCWYGKNQRTLLQTVERQRPDAVLMGGDMFDEKLPRKNMESVVQTLGAKYPCYCVMGNHECRSGQLPELLRLMKSCKIQVLAGEKDVLNVNGQPVQICGIADEEIELLTHWKGESLHQLQTLRRGTEDDCYRILLVHRPDYVESYFRYGFDLVLSGHTHGGQWRIPGVINGVYAPNQGFFPRYAGGRYSFPEGEMIVSRGLSREQVMVPRICNRPELVIVELEGIGIKGK